MRKITATIIGSIDALRGLPHNSRRDETIKLSRRDTLDTITMGSSDLRDIFHY